MTGHRQCVGVGEGEAGRPGLGTGVTQLRKALEGDDRGVVLAEIPPGTGLHDGEFDLADAVEPLCLLGADQIKGALGTAKATLAVRHDRQERVGTRHPASRAQIAERLGEVAGTVGRDADGLADHPDPGREATCDLRVLVRPLRVVLAESPLGRHKVAGDQLREVEGKGTQFLADLLVELLRGDVRGELRQLLTLAAGSLVAAAGPVIPAVAGAGPLTVAVTVPEGTPPAGTVVTVERPALTTVIAVERRTVTTAIVTVEAGTVATVATTGTVITIERPALTIRARTITTTGLVAVTVRTTLTTAIITVERGTITAVIAIERRTTPTGTVVTVERRTTRTTVVTVERRTITAITAIATTGTVVTIERRTTPTRTVITIERPALTTVIAVERRTVTTAIVTVEAGTVATVATTGTVITIERRTTPTRTVITIERPALTTVGTRTILTARLITVTVRTTLTTAIIAIERRTTPTRTVITIERRTITAIPTAGAIVPIEGPALTTVVAVERGTTRTTVVTVVRRPVPTVTRAVRTTAGLVAVTIRTLTLATRP
ncbi:hypothetical protein [Streptosporangium sp. OZ121]|uniref:hypothetical protein n=1 Tax=Streptosporangium sp. OZ121 TaxID=3444183 RepID=UPI003F79A3F4